MSRTESAPQVIRERDSLRRFIRIRMPVLAVFEGRSYPVKDWSLGGMAIHDIDRDTAVGDFLKAEVVVPFGEFSFTTEVVCQVVHVDPAARRIGCRFVDLRAEQLPLLRYLVESHLAGRTPTADGLMSTLSREAAATCERPTPGAGARGPTGLRRLARGVLRAAMLVVAGAGLAALLAAAVYSHVLTVEAVTAAVVGEAVDVRAPAEGRITGRRLTPGTRVKTGDVLFTIRNEPVVYELEAAKADVVREERKFETLQETLHERQAFFGEYKIVADAEERKATAEYERSQTALALARKRLDRVAELSRRELVAAQAVETERNAVAVAEMEYRRAESGLLQAQSNARMAAQGHFHAGARVDGLEPREIERQISVAKAAIEVARARVRGLRQQLDNQAQTVVRAPCDCVVHAVASSSGEWVAKAQSVYTLERAAESGVVIETLVAQDTANTITVGAKAEIALADRMELVRGEVVAVNRTASGLRRTGLPVPAGSSEQHARVLVAPLAGLRDVPAGLPARVKFEVRTPLPFWRGFVMNELGRISGSRG